MLEKNNLADITDPNENLVLDEIVKNFNKLRVLCEDIKENDKLKKIMEDKYHNVSIDIKKMNKFAEKDKQDKYRDQVKKVFYRLDKIFKEYDALIKLES